MKRLFIIAAILMLPSLVSPKSKNLETKDLAVREKSTADVKPIKFRWTAPSDSLVSLIKEHEGLELEAYICPAGKRTIGYGHRTNTLNRITEEEAYNLLLSDLKKVDKVLYQLVPDNLTEGQYEALLSFCFNVGTERFRKSTLRRMVLNNPYNPDIVLEFGKWRKGGGKVLNGLVKRRKDEASLYFPPMVMDFRNAIDGVLQTWRGEYIDVY